MLNNIKTNVVVFVVQNMIINLQYLFPDFWINMNGVAVLVKMIH